MPCTVLRMIPIIINSRILLEIDKPKAHGYTCCLVTYNLRSGMMEKCNEIRTLIERIDPKGANISSISDSANPEGR